MNVQTDDYGTVDIGDLEGEALAEAYAEAKARRDELEMVVDRHANTLADWGLDFADFGRFLAVADRDKAVARLGEEAVKRLEA